MIVKIFDTSTYALCSQYAVSYTSMCSFLLALALANRLLTCAYQQVSPVCFRWKGLLSSQVFLETFETWKYVFISFNLEKERSTVTTVTGIVANRIRSLYTCEKDELTRISSIKWSITDCRPAISFLNSLTNERNSETSSSVKSFGYIAKITSAAASSFGDFSGDIFDG